MNRFLADQRIREQAALLDKTLDANLILSLDERIVFWNQGAERLYGWTREEASGKTLQELFGRQLPADWTRAREAVLERDEWTGTLHAVKRTGQEITVESRWTLLRDDAGKSRAILSSSIDITEKQKLLTHVIRMQRLESIGALAGGIAHDMNNVLTPLMMAVPLLQTDLPPADRQTILVTMQTSLERAAAMVKQILSFARVLEGERIIFSLEPLVKELGKFLTQTLPKSILIRVSTSPDLWVVQADATQMYQLVMALCLNARDAMPDGGTLTITLRNGMLDSAGTHPFANARPGAYVVLTVEDTGTGMAPDIQNKVFDPFFTTKLEGQSMGLGLPSVRSILDAHCGFVTVHSEPGKGSRFGVYLPAYNEPGLAPNIALDRTQRSAGRRETILVVDDEPSIRELCRVGLEAAGYTVLTAADGSEAAALFAVRQPDIRLVITDMVMPIMDGSTLIGTLKAMNPDIRIVPVTGFPGTELALEQIPNIRAVLYKPFTADRLISAVREALD